MDWQYKSKVTEYFESVIAHINNNRYTIHFQIMSIQEKSVRYSVWKSVGSIEKPQQKQKERTNNLAIPTAATTTFSVSAMENGSAVTHSANYFWEP